MVTGGSVLSVDGMIVTFKNRGGRNAGIVHAVNNVSLDIGKGETAGLVGESGCGKTTLSRAVLRLVPLQSGTVTVNGRDWTALNSGSLRPLRREVQMIFQNPYASLNPRMTVHDLLTEPIRYHLHLSKKESTARAVMLLESVGIESRSMRRFPHEFSGGQRQRIAIARAISTDPILLIADEPVSSLDVSVQAQILNLLMELRSKMGLSMLFISHDLSIVKHISDRVAVMYLGKIVEIGTRDEIFSNPLHPYTHTLLNAVTVPDLSAEPRSVQPLQGEPPSPLADITGCPFRSRCPYAIDKCVSTDPALENAGATHHVACIRNGHITLI